MRRFVCAVTAACAGLVWAMPAASAERIKCRLTYDLKGWSIFYKYAEGDGRITCSNGQARRVHIVTHGGGVTFGTHQIDGGKGAFSAVRAIDDLYGTYVEADAHAGAGRSADARVLVKSDVSLSLSGTGQGLNVGVAVGGFTIAPR
jgi:hypothetical protein